MPRPWNRPRPFRAARSRGVTLVELLIMLALVALVMGMAIGGMGLIRSARLKRSAIMVTSAVRVAYTHASVLSKPVRLVFDFDAHMIVLEESSSEPFSSFFLDKKDKAAGGAAAVTEAEQKAQAEVEQILKGPRPPRPSFKPTKAFGFEPDKDKPGKELESGVRFVQIETGHQEAPVTEGRAYIYFWPGGQTERAAIQLSLGDGEDAQKMTVLVSPLSGKTSIQKGAVAMPRPKDNREESQGDQDM
jgi:general secretion pathway protein H